MNWLQVKYDCEKETVNKTKPFRDNFVVNLSPNYEMSGSCTEKFFDQLK